MSNIKNQEYMQLAIEQALKGSGAVKTNPLVGCIIVKNDQIIGEGYHAHFGQEHAEVNAIKYATTSVEGATAYVTLEPCGHFGKTPPCAHLLVESKIQKVVIGAVDPTLSKEHSGVIYLRENGVEVVILNDETAQKLIQPFLVNKLLKMPYVTLKLATSIDFKTATSTLQSKWITSQATRNYSQKLRSKYQAIAVGVETVLFDDPELTNRQETNEYQPIKVVFDTNLRTPMHAKIFNSGSVIIITGQKNNKNNYPGNVQIIECETKNQKIDLNDAMQKLFALGIGTILVEGGSKLISSFANEKLFDQIDHFIAPIIIGDSPKVALKMSSIDLINEATKMIPEQFVRIDQDTYIKYRRNRCSQD
jgi:diaminohydroxyphosphoribosylaminopyrimidine deaminase/5-amino-6-(5-phosphoribosylamino)uracil reductase